MFSLTNNKHLYKSVTLVTTEQGSHIFPFSFLLHSIVPSYRTNTTIAKSNVPADVDYSSLYSAEPEQNEKVMQCSEGNGA